MDLSAFKVVVIGSGFFGSTVACQLVAALDLPVLIIEKRQHVGGNAYSQIDPDTGIEYHAYGSHIFHTSNEAVWDFICRFTKFNNYRHRVHIKFRDKVYTMPINLMTINSFFGRNFTPSEARLFIENEIAQEEIANPNSFEEKAITLVGRSLYEAFICGYSQKQWETDLRDLPAELITRLPVRYNYNDSYFSDRYEGIPVDGYAAVFTRMLSHEKIQILTGCDYFAIADQIAPDALKVFTGPIDRYYGFCLGRLGWRTLKFELERVPLNDFQGASVMNYADPNIPYTRIHEFKHFHPERRYSTENTLIAREYSLSAQGEDEPYYPINTEQDRRMFEGYRRLAEQERCLVFGGRLGTYRYIDMHQAIGAALKAVENEILPKLRCAS